MGNACATINMLSIYIAPVDIYVEPVYCGEPCNVYVAVTWLNYDYSPGQLTPGLIVDGVLTIFSPVTLRSGDAITLGFDIFGMTAGIHTIQPSPYGDSFMETVDVIAATSPSLPVSEFQMR